MRPIKRFGIAAASNSWMAFQNEPRFMAACRLSNVLSNDGSITASRFMLTLEIRFICLPRDAYSRSRVCFAVASAALSPPGRSTIGKSKRQPKLPGDHQALRECLGYANETTIKWDNSTSGLGRGVARRQRHILLPARWPRLHCNGSGRLLH